MIEKLLQEIAATAEVMGHELTDAALAIMAQDLEEYPVDDVRNALTKVRRECSRFTLAEVIKRLPNGFIGANEAWASFPKDENATAVVTNEAQQAWGAAVELYYGGDAIGARMAFIETYNRVVSETKDRVPRYVVTLGHNRDGRADPIIQAVEQGKLPPQKAKKYLCDLSYDGKDALRLEHVIEQKINHAALENDGAKKISSVVSMGVKK